MAHETASGGLSAAEAAERLAKDGPNELSAQRVTRWQVFARQISSPFVWLLIVAAVISWLLGEWTEGWIIITFVSINALLGFFQEFHAEHSLHLLKDLTKPKALVRRQGKELLIHTREIVVGDIVVLKAGDVIPADGELVWAQALQVDESILTGESRPVVKDVTHGNTVLSATHVLSGTADMLVTATGIATEFGRTAKLASETSRIGELERGLSNFSTFILKLVGVTLLILVPTNIALKGTANMADIFIFAIALAVSVIPEALPVVLSISLSRGALRMASKGVVVKRLSAIEDLGAITVLCTDKTGTLTRNEMEISAVNGDQNEVLRLAALGAPDILAKHTHLDPFDLAIEARLDRHIRASFEGWRAVTDIPFDPERKRNSVLVGHEDERLLVVRGAPETLFECCVADNQDRKHLNTWIQEQGRAGCRVLAIASKALPASVGYDVTEEEHGLVLTGLIAFKDPVKPEAEAAIRHAERLGIKVQILTGDAPDVAMSVARELHVAGLREPLGMTGADFANLDEKMQRETVKKIDVFSRVNPEQKYDIIKRLQETGESVGFLGEGINDAPALKVADVGLVVRHASDVAQDAADIVLLRSGLDVIVGGVRLGRETFVATNSYLITTLASNFGNFFAVAVATLLIPQLPLLPVQILLLNLLSDFPMIAMSSDHIDPDDIKKPRRYDVGALIRFAVTLGIVSTAFDFLFFGIWANGPVSVLRTNWFIASVLTEIALIYSVRTHGSLLRAKAISPVLGGLTLLAVIAAVILPYTPIGERFFGFVPPSAGALAIIFTAVLCYVASNELVKRWIRTRS